MKKKIIAYSFLPVLGLIGVMGAGVASANGFFGGAINLSPDQIVARQQSMFQNEAQILGISIDDVKAAWADGKTMQQIMKEKNISADQVAARTKDLRTQELKKQLQTLVDKGIITQAQADKRLQFMQSNSEMGHGKMGRFRGGFGF